MEGDWNGQMGFQNRSPELNSTEEGIDEKKVAESAVNSSSLFNNSANEGVIGGCYGSGWDPIASLCQNGSFEASLMASHGNFPLYTESAFGGSFSEMMNPYGCAKDSVVIKKAPMDSVQPEETSPNGKRKRAAGGDSHRDDDALDEKETDEKKQKVEDDKDNSADGEGSKGSYVHMRARKGQATNSHSLAERVRREKINDRMKLLQELVPGCNKITGKAVMLDEIINYVQSLQQQVEFLSMKLATVNPELNFNIEQLLTKDILHSRGNSAPILGLAPGMSSSHLCSTDVHQGAFSGISNTVTPFHSASQAIKGMWDGELQNLLHMGFEPNPPNDNLGPNGNSER